MTQKLFFIKRMLYFQAVKFLLIPNSIPSFSHVFLTSLFELLLLDLRWEYTA